MLLRTGAPWQGLPEFPEVYDTHLVPTVVALRPSELESVLLDGLVVRQDRVGRLPPFSKHTEDKSTHSSVGSEASKGAPGGVWSRRVTLHARPGRGGTRAGEAVTFVTFVTFTISPSRGLPTPRPLSSTPSVRT